MVLCSFGRLGGEIARKSFFVYWENGKEERIGLDRDNDKMERKGVRRRCKWRQMADQPWKTPIQLSTR